MNSKSQLDLIPPEFQNFKMVENNDLIITVDRCQLKKGKNEPAKFHTTISGRNRLS